MSDFKEPKRVNVDVEAVLRALFPQGMVLVKDLQDDEIICRVCAGLGASRWASSYGLQGADPALGSFPYTQETVGPCNACFNGVQRLCPHCNQPHSKVSYRCSCRGVVNERGLKQTAKEDARRSTLPRIALSDYTLDAVYDPDASEYVYEANFADLEPDATYFACTATSDWLRIHASSVIERMEEAAHEDFLQGSDMYTLKEGAEAALQEVLDKWVGEWVDLHQAYFPDEGLIVVAPTQEGE